MNEDILMKMMLQKIEELIRENERLKLALEQVETHLKENEDTKVSIRETLAEAHRLAEDYKNNARSEAELIVKEAEIKAEQILNNSKCNNNRI